MVEILKSLDKKFNLKTIKDTSERWNYFKNHPLIKTHDFDSRHRDPYE